RLWRCRWSWYARTLARRSLRRPPSTNPRAVTGQNLESQAVTLITPQRQSEDKAGATVGIFDREAAAVGFRDLAGDGQAEPGAAGVAAAGGVQAHEPLEDGLTMLRGDAFPV